MSMPGKLEEGVNVEDNVYIREHGDKFPKGVQKLENTLIDNASTTQHVGPHEIKLIALFSSSCIFSNADQD